jgi:hypothetical protein
LLLSFRKFSPYIVNEVAKGREYTFTIRYKRMDLDEEAEEDHIFVEVELYNGATHL